MCHLWQSKLKYFCLQILGRRSNEITDHNNTEDCNLENKYTVANLNNNFGYMKGGNYFLMKI